MQITNILLSKEHEKLLEEMATVIDLGGDKFYYMPYWFHKSDDGLIIMSFDNLPQNVKDFIQKDREK